MKNDSSPKQSPSPSSRSGAPSSTGKLRASKLPASLSDPGLPRMGVSGVTTASLVTKRGDGAGDEE